MNDLMQHFLRDTCYAEKLGVRDMAKMAKAVENTELKEAIEESEKGLVLDAPADRIRLGHRIEHHEIARYDAMVAWTKQMGNTQAVQSGEEDDNEADKGEDESPEPKKKPKKTGSKKQGAILLLLPQWETRQEA